MKNFLIILAALTLVFAVVITSCKKKDKNTAVTSVDLRTTSGHFPSDALGVGATEQLVAIISPEDATNKNVTWSTNNGEVVQIDQTGLVTALSNGTAIVTVTTQDGNKTATHTYTVSKRRAPVTAVKLSLNDNQLEIVDGIITVMDKSSFDLSVTVFPEQDTDSTTTNRRIIWGTNNPTVALVSDGTVVALFPGEALIWAVSVDEPTIGDTLKLVVKPFSVDGISLNLNAEEIKVHQTLPLDATVTPMNASVQAVRWESRDTTIATVSATGVVKGTGEGHVYIVATAVDNALGTFADSALITVNGVGVLGISLKDADSCKTDNCEIKLFAGGVYTFRATIEPHDATDKSIKWTSSDETIAYFDVMRGDSATVVTRNKAGRATITVTTLDGDFTATATIVVTTDDKPAECIDEMVFSLGTITYGDATNTDIRIGVRSVGNLIWSLPVIASACNKQEYYASQIRAESANNKDFKVDCRQGRSDQPGTNNTFLSWCAMKKYANVICPHPWRVPTREDWAVVDIHFDGDGKTARFNGACFPNDSISGNDCLNERLKGTEVLASINKIVPDFAVTWTGAVVGLGSSGSENGVVPQGFGHNSSGTNAEMTRYWHFDERNAGQGNAFEIVRREAAEEGQIRPQDANSKHSGLVVRCVRDR